MSRMIVKNAGNGERIVSLVLGAYMVGTALRQRRGGNVISLLTGSYLIFRGGVGYCPVSRWMGKKDTQNPAINIKTVMTVNKPREMVYRYWRSLSNLPSFMKHLQQVEVIDERKSHWTARVPGTGKTVEWDAEIVKDEANELIGWQSINGAVIRNAGKVQFFDAPRNGTEVRVIFSYHPPGGGVGTGAAKLLNPVFKGMVEDEIRNFKRVIEAGEIPTTSGQPAGKRTGKFKII